MLLNEVLHSSKEIVNEELGRSKLFGSPQRCLTAVLKSSQRKGLREKKNYRKDYDFMENFSLIH